MFLPAARRTLLEVKAALEAAGIEFIGSPTDRPGIRLCRINASRQTTKAAIAALICLMAGGSPRQASAGQTIQVNNGRTYYCRKPSLC